MKIKIIIFIILFWLQGKMHFACANQLFLMIWDVFLLISLKVTFIASKMYVKYLLENSQFWNNVT